MMNRTMGKVALGAILLAWVGLSFAADWPQWRGPQRDDISQETGLLKQWPAGGPKLAWKATGLGGGFAGLAVVGDTLYTMGDIQGKEYALALDLKTQKILWSTELGPEYKNPNGSGPRCTPTVEGGMVYVLTPQADLVCLQADGGKEVWRKNLLKDFGGKLMSGWGYSESPLVDGDNVVCTPGGSKGSVVALNKKTGEKVWQSAEITDQASYSSLLPVVYGGARQFIQLSDKSIYAVAADSGKLLWRAPCKGKVAVITTPVFKDGIVFATSGYGTGCNAFKVTAEGGAFKAEEIYANKEMANHHGGVVLIGDYIYGYSDLGKKLRCMELKTGKVVWENPSVGKCSLTCADGMLYARAEAGAGTVALVAASPEGYKEAGRFDQPDRTRQNSWVHPVVANGMLFLRDQDLLLGYSVK